MRTNRDLRIGELLDLLSPFMAFSAFVFVERHSGGCSWWMASGQIRDGFCSTSHSKWRLMKKLLRLIEPQEPVGSVELYSLPSSTRRTLAIASTLRRLSTAAFAAAALGTSI